jgi:hypothetical protein
MITQPEALTIIQTMADLTQVRIDHCEFVPDDDDGVHLVLNITSEYGSREYEATHWNDLSSDEFETLIRNTMLDWL